MGCTPMYMRNIADINIIPKWKDIRIADIPELSAIAPLRCKIGEG